MSLISLKTEFRQELKLTPQLLQSMELLQMSSQELLDYIGRMAEENPLIELGELSQVREAYEELCQKVSWLDRGDAGGTFFHSDASLPEQGAADSKTESLAAFLFDQLDRRHLPKPLLALTRYIAELLDEDGWLAQEDLDELKRLKIPTPLIDQALEIVQSLEPAGVGARDLSECLLLQVNRQGIDDALLCRLIQDFLPDLGKKHYGHISRELGVSVEEIQAAEKKITALNPRPGQEFQPEEPTVYIRPDLFVVELDGELQILLNEYYLPRVSISDYYVRLLRSDPEKDSLEYLQQKLQQAKWLLNGMERRSSTLQRCAEAILAVQHDFFAGKTATPAAMSLASLAKTLSVHPSTVSRATRGKYLQCRQGTYPLRYFFARSLGPDECSVQRVRQRILELIRDEDPKHPLSDQKLCALLEKEGIPVARRTVAKYRMELGLESSTVRKYQTRS